MVFLYYLHKGTIKRSRFTDCRVGPILVIKVDLLVHVFTRSQIEYQLYRNLKRPRYFFFAMYYAIDSRLKWNF